MALNLNGNFLTGKATGTFSNQYVGNALQIRNMDPKAYILRQNWSPFVVLLKLMGMKAAAVANRKSGFAPNSKTKNVNNPKFEWFEEDLGEPTATLLADVTGGTSTSLTVSAADSLMFKPGALIFIKATGEIVRATAVNHTTGVITCGTISDENSGAAGKITNSVDISADNPEIVLVSSAFGEASGPADPINFGAVEEYNYCQIFKKSTRNSNTNEATSYYGNINQMSHQKKRLFDQFLLEKARAYFLGQRSSAVDSIGSADAYGHSGVNGGTFYRTTGGLEHFVKSKQHLSTSVTYDKFMEFCKDAYEYDGEERIFICNPAMMMLINQALHANGSGNINTNYELSPKSKEFGIKIKRILTVMGDMDLLVDRTMGILYDKPTAFALDMSCIEEMVLRPDKWEENIQLPGWDFRMDQILCESGLKVTLEKRHAKWEIDSGATSGVTI